MMVRRKQQEQEEQQRKVEEHLRRQEFKDQLDAKVFEEQLEATKQCKGGANPAVISTHDGVRTTDFKFSTNQVQSDISLCCLLVDLWNIALVSPAPVAPRGHWQVQLLPDFQFHCIREGGDDIALSPRSPVDPVLPSTRQLHHVWGPQRRVRVHQEQLPH